MLFVLEDPYARHQSGRPRIFLGLFREISLYVV